jgi:hypothetical protein
MWRPQLNIEFLLAGRVHIVLDLGGEIIADCSSYDNQA